MCPRSRLCRPTDATDCLARRRLCDDSQSAPAARGSKGAIAPLWGGFERGANAPLRQGTFSRLDTPVGCQMSDKSYPGSKSLLAGARIAGLSEVIYSPETTAKQLAVEGNLTRRRRYSTRLGCS